eukprot:scaffold26605_cov148-Skeletonema_menzelii.AAC.3
MKTPRQRTNVPGMFRLASSPSLFRQVPPCHLRLISSRLSLRPASPSQPLNPQSSTDTALLLMLHYC